MQTPAWNNGLVVKPAEMNLLNALAVALASWWADAFGQQNVVEPGGGTLTAGSGPPIVINYAAFTAYVNGPVRLSRYTPGAGTVTLAAADTTYARYDLIVGTASQTTPVDSAGNPTVLDVLTVTKVTGVPAAPPLFPDLPGNSVQLGYVLVPANATSAATCTITQALGPLSPNNFQDLTSHIAASMATAVVHGFRATTAGGTGNNMLAQTDAYGNVGSAGGLWDGTARRVLHPFNDGSHIPGEIPQYDANGNVASSIALWDGTAARQLQTFNNGNHDPGVIPQYNANKRVEDSERLQGLQTGSGSGNIPVLDSNGAVAKAEGLVAGGVTHKFTAGKTAPFSTVNQADVAWTVTLDDDSFTPTVAAPSVYAVGATATHQVMATVTSISAGSVSGVVYQVGGPNITIQVGVFAYI